MSRGRAISLSDRQLQVIMTAARSMPGGDTRSKFLAGVADRLTGLDTIDDAAVEQAVQHAIARLMPPAA